MLLISHSPKETRQFAANLAKKMKPGTVLALIGDLGSGKTTFVQGLAEGLGISKKYYVNSPTFTLINEYEGKIPLFHFDLYRLGSVKELADLGFEEYLEKNGIVVVEWAEKLPPAELQKMVVVRFSMLAGEKRQIEIVPPLSVRGG
ncbi:MAG: tRNA (adenosine(37)-N6)-threonylcarbamoyltransferase complex ATPase subunit type 1 TsaE [Deltaproteobacteria bacterium]|nr:tRNA (adenosine(37)-N6)-threonylcarbamoyltransferase complex ATPase subunit type 1 TsaE [Deltaproteobacteria bacterium]